jgi:iron complex outermembrane receptor protein
MNLEHCAGRPRRIGAFLCAVLTVLLTIGGFRSIALAEELDTLYFQLPDTIDVAGKRLPLDPLHAPMATTKIVSQDLQAKRAAGLDEALGLVPGVVAQSRSGGSDVRITMRGFGARGAGERSNAGTTRGIRIMLNGFPLTEPDGRTALDLVDIGSLSRIDVVRSNSSALFGSASGGLINLVSDAAFSHPYYEVRGSGGSFGYQHGSAAVGLLAGKARIRLSFMRDTFDGWRKHSDRDATLGEVSVLVDPTPRSTLAVFLQGTRNRYKIPGALTQSELDADPRAANPDNVTRNERRDNRLGRFGVRWQQEVADNGILMITAYSEPKYLERSERNRYRDFNRVHSGGTALYSHSMQAAPSWNVRWSAGVDEAYQDGSILFYNLGPFGTRGTDLVSNTREGNNTFGVYGEADINHGPWDMNIGGRWDFLRYIFEDHQDASLNASRTLKRGSPRAGISYRYATSHSVYAALSGGIEGPAFNEIDPPPPFDATTGLNPFLEPAHSLTYEAGAKGRLANTLPCVPDLRYDAAFYRIDIDNDIIPFNGGTYYQTAGKSKRTGFEAGLRSAPETGLRAGLALTVSKNEYVDYIAIPAGDSIPRDFGGNETAGIPSVVVNGSLGYTFPQGFGVEMEVRHLGKFYADDANTTRIDAFTTLDLTIEMKRTLSTVDASLFASLRNLADEAYVSSVYINGVGGRFYEPGMEQNVLIGFRLKGRLPAR